MTALRKSLLPTSPSTSPAIKRYGTPYALVNPESKAENVLAIVESVVHAPLPAGYREITDIVKDHEKNAGRAAALTRARARLGALIENHSNDKPTLAALRLKAGLSQAALAELLGNSQSSYSLIESGKRDMLLSTFEKIVEVLAVSRDGLAAAIKNTQEKSKLWCTAGTLKWFFAMTFVKK